MKKNRFYFLIIAVFLLFAACSNASGGGGDDSENNHENSSKTVVSKKIGAAGGVISDGDNITLTIPEGALSEDKTISLEYFSKLKEEDGIHVDFLGRVEFGPDGTVFNEPVEVKIKLSDSTSKTSISVFCYDEEEDIWDFVTPAAVEDGYASFSINHFSVYELMDKFPTKTDKFVELVDTALATGKSDDWIIDQYTDYLINEERVLDNFKYYDGYWFEPCGIYISGDYHVNGKENKASMGKRIGTSNMVGNKFGFSCLESGNYNESISHKDFKDKKKNAKENQKLYSAYFIVDYQMIEPKIKVTADKTNLQKGEKTNVEVYCYYEDLAMNGYELTLPYQLKHFSASVNKIVTDSEGKATFTVTAKNKGAERVKVMFYKTGYLTGRQEGIAYSAGYEAFSCDTETIIVSGHIKESLDYNFDVKPYDYYIETEKTGQLQVTAEYDYEALLDIVDKENGKVEGVIYFSDPGINYNTKQQLEFTEQHISAFRPEENHECQIKLGYGNNKKPETFYMEYHVSGTIKDNKCELRYNDVYKGPVNFYWVEGKSNWLVSCVKGASNLTNVISFGLIIGGDKKPLFDFTFENGTETITKNEFKDEFSEVVFGPYHWSECGGEYYFGGFSETIGTLKSSQTTQTITVELPEDDE